MENITSNYDCLFPILKTFTVDTEGYHTHGFQGK